VDILLSGVGAGAGALASERVDVPLPRCWAAGWLPGAGSTLHNSINITTDDVPLLTLSSLEGLWLGAWLPRLLYKGEDVNQRNQVGGLVAAGLGVHNRHPGQSLGEARRQPGCVTGTTSAIGAALSGGSVLLAD